MKNIIFHISIFVFALFCFTPSFAMMSDSEDELLEIETKMCKIAIETRSSQERESTNPHRMFSALLDYPREALTCSKFVPVGTISSEQKSFSASMIEGGEGKETKSPIYEAEETFHTIYDDRPTAVSPSLTEAPYISHQNTILPKATDTGIFMEFCLSEKSGIQLTLPMDFSGIQFSISSPRKRVCRAPDIVEEFLPSVLKSRNPKRGSESDDADEYPFSKKDRPMRAKFFLP